MPIKRMPNCSLSLEAAKKVLEHPEGCTFDQIIAAAIAVTKPIYEGEAR